MKKNLLVILIVFFVKNRGLFKLFIQYFKLFIGVKYIIYGKTNFFRSINKHNYKN